MADITIPLGRAAKNDIASKSDCAKVIRKEYAKRYLSSLGVGSNVRSRSLQTMIIENAPLQECSIEAAWGDNSIVADTLLIMQPESAAARAAAFQEAEAEAKAEQQSLDQAAAKCGRRRQHTVHTAWANPHPTWELPLAFRPEGPTGAKGTDTIKCPAAMARPPPEWVPSTPTDVALTEELERMRRQARKNMGYGCVGAFGLAAGGSSSSSSSSSAVPAETVVKDRIAPEMLGPIGEARVDDFKRKYVLPFACERKNNAADHGLALWELHSARHLEVAERDKPDASIPISVSLEEIQDKAVKLANGHLPLELLTSRQSQSTPALMASARACLVALEVLRLVGLLSHMVYWNILGHLHAEERRLPKEQREAMVQQIHGLWSVVVSPHKESVSGAGFVLPAVLLSIKISIEHIFRSQYPMIFERVSPGSTLVEEINVTCMGLLDPDCAFSRFGALDTTPEAIRLWRKLEVLLDMRQGALSRSQARFFRTSPLVQNSVGAHGPGPSDARTRRFLAKSASERHMRDASPASRTEQDACASLPSRQHLSRATSAKLVTRQRPSSAAAAPSKPLLRRPPVPPNPNVQSQSSFGEDRPESSKAWASSASVAQLQPGRNKTSGASRQRPHSANEVRCRDRPMRLSPSASLTRSGKPLAQQSLRLQRFID
eukprot:TRINITY_DN5122_c0_g1_i1.p1 TRINITY_DN5122_c0_g1~~TRINITY_DN5122_c0_g1_i1.p1  ORF type:complete len:661 (+),score=108.79 TRINITY_DN5122_c0_g1_i1:95-2077(+)